MKSNFVIMGLPASGKTTFLAALWHIVEAGEITSRLKLKSYEGDLSYLNRIAEAWRTFQKVPRTSQVGDVNVIINLLDSDTGVEGTAFFPDLAGETFEAQVEARRCRPEFIESLAHEDGILFFISANVKGEALSIVELNAVLPKLDIPHEVVAEPETWPATAPEWKPGMVSTQVHVVQILSDLLRPPFRPRKRRLALIISAWDLVDVAGLKPIQWLELNMPLVSQFLKTNVASFEYQLYGISAQGVSLEDAAAVKEAAKQVASRRVRVIGPAGIGSDLTMPLVWLMSKE